MTKRLGPFLCKPTANSMSFWMYVEDSSNIEITIPGHSEKPIILKPLLGKDQAYFVFMATVETLSSDTEYKYSVKIDKEIHIPAGANADDLRFRTLPDAESEIHFVSMSCHGIKEYEKHKAVDDLPAWFCWDRLYNEVKENPVHFLVLGGDQVYMDSFFDGKIGSLKSDKKDEYRTIIKDCYLEYWENPSYQRILCQVPSFLMWDDHDIIDGFGSRPDSYNGVLSMIFKKASGDAFKKNWLLLGELQKEAFLYFQGSRNPADNLVDLKNNFSFDFNHPSFSLLALDLRSERNVKKGEMITQENKDKIAVASKNLTGKKVFIISPVTVARMAGPIEGAFGQFSNAIWRITSFSGQKPNFLKTTIAILLFLISFISFAIYEPSLKFFGGAGITFVASVLLILLAIFPKLRYLSKNARRNSLILLWVLAIFSAFYIVDLFYSGNLIENIKHFNLSEHLCLLWKNKKIILVASIVVPLLSSVKTVFDINKKWFQNICYGLNAVLVILFIWNMHLSKIYSGLDWAMMISLYIASVTFLLNMICESMGVIDELADLDDDIKDGWSSHENEKELIWLKDKIILDALEDKKTFILSGDIHTGGVTNLFFNKRLIPQITSSPISYMPMPAIGEKLTSGSKPIYIPTKENPICVAENVFYISERNFVRISLFKNSIDVKYFFEKHSEPVVVSYVD